MSETNKEGLRQQQETFNQHKQHEERWFTLRIRMGYAAIFLALGIVFISGYVVFNSALFSSDIVTIATTALFVDLLAAVFGVWRVVLNPDFMTKLSPVTPLDDDGAVEGSPINANSDLVILKAEYGANDVWVDVTETLRARVKNNKLEISVANVLFGGDPIKTVKKLLKVAYSYGGQTHSEKAIEGNILELPKHTQP